jgi:hypothetical protein
VESFKLNATDIAVINWDRMRANSELYTVHHETERENIILKAIQD